jgi:hypothetical protein
VKIRWFGQSAFLFTGEQRVAIDPFRPVTPEMKAPVTFAYPAIEGAEAELLLVTHEHLDHNLVEAIGGGPHVLRSTTGTWDDTPIGTVVGIASEHDPVAGTQRGPNTIFVFALDGLRVCHFGDFGQTSLRPEQRKAIGEVDVLLLPVGGGPTIGGEQAASLVEELRPASSRRCTTGRPHSTSWRRPTISSPASPTSRSYDSRRARPTPSPCSANPAVRPWPSCRRRSPSCNLPLARLRMAALTRPGA